MESLNHQGSPSCSALIKINRHSLNAACAPVYNQVWQTLAAVLHMSNLQFDKVDNEQGEIAAISDRAVRERVENRQTEWVCAEQKNLSLSLMLLMSLPLSLVEDEIRYFRRHRRSDWEGGGGVYLC